MSRWNSNRWNFWNKILAGVCVAIAVILAVLLFLYMKAEREKSESIARLAQEQETAAVLGSSGEESAVAQILEAESTVQFEGNSADSTPAETVEEPGNTDDDQQLAGISWRGDEFLSGEDVDTKSASVLLQQKLQEEGYEVPVENYSLTGAGTLSQLRLAGVSEDIIDDYVESHSQENGADSKMETGVRDFSTEELERSDQGYLPVIFMGYYGGWNNDPVELAEQIQLILNTYDNPERFLVVGLHPVSGGGNPEDYREIMESTWGERYLDLEDVLEDATASSYDGQKQVAQAVFEKLSELGDLNDRQE